MAISETMERVSKHVTKYAYMYITGLQGIPLSTTTTTTTTTTTSI